MIASLASFLIGLTTIEELETSVSDLSEPSTLSILAVGTSATALSFLADDAVRDFFKGKNRMDGWRQVGNSYGDYPAQFGLTAFSIAVGVWQSNPELLRFGVADLEALSFTVGTSAALKYSIRRDRPNGQKRSFPSGHSSQAFATAGVLWNLGHPILSGLSLALGGLTVAARLDSNKHYLSDVVAGATIGFVYGYAFSLHHRSDKEQKTQWILAPYLESRRDMGLTLRIRF